MRSFLKVTAIAAALSVCAASAVLARSHTVNIGGVAISVPVGPGKCAVNGSDPRTQAWFNRAATAQQRIGNRLNVIVIDCNEVPYVAGEAVGRLSTWTMVYMSGQHHRAPAGMNHQSYSEQFCKTLPGYIEKSGKSVRDKVSSIAKDVYGKDIQTSFDKPFMYGENCLMPLRNNTPGNAVYGMFTAVLTKGRVFFVSTYSHNSQAFPDMVNVLINWSNYARGVSANNAAPQPNQGQSPSQPPSNQPNQSNQNNKSGQDLPTDILNNN